MIVPKLPTTNIKTYFEKIDNFRGGSQTWINEARMDTKFARESTNLTQVKDGVWATRPGRRYYGQAISGATTIDGAMEFEKSDGTREIIAIAGGKVWKSQDRGTWTEVTGATFTSGHTPYFYQTHGKLYISNRHDDQAYYDGTDLHTFTQLAAPDALTGSLTKLTSGNYNNYYEIVAINDVGFTEPSEKLSITTNKQRDSWASGEYITLTVTPVTNATGYQIYWHEDEANVGLLIAELTATTTSFLDTGGADYPFNESVEVPDDNTTGAPKIGPMEVSGARMWTTYDIDNKWRVYATGTDQNFGRYSSFYGGFYADLETGGKNKPVSVVHYRTGKGDPIMTVLCTSPNGNGTIFQIETTSQTVGEVTYYIPVAYKLVGSIGADAPLSVIKVGDNVLFFNNKGVYALRNKQQMFNVLSTDDLSSPIRDRIESLNPQQVQNVAAYYKPPRAYFSVPEGSENDSIALFNMEQSNWTWKWTFGVKSFFEYTENATGDSITHFLGIPTSGNQLVEISDTFVGDFGQPFYQSYISPLIPVSKDSTDKANIKEIVYELGNFTGTATAEVLGVTESKEVSSLASQSKSSNIGTTGWGNDLFDSMLFDDVTGTPTTFAQSSTKILINNIPDKVYYIQFKLYSSSLTRFELLSIQAKGTLQPSRASNSWAN